MAPAGGGTCANLGPRTREGSTAGPAALGVAQNTNGTNRFVVNM
jgi:hypothetical protein